MNNDVLNRLSLYALPIEGPHYTLIHVLKKTNDKNQCLIHIKFGHIRFLVFLMGGDDDITQTYAPWALHPMCFCRSTLKESVDCDPQLIDQCSCCQLFSLLHFEWWLHHSSPLVSQMLPTLLAPTPIKDSFISIPICPRSSLQHAATCANILKSSRNLMFRS